MFLKRTVGVIYLEIRCVSNTWRIAMFFLFNFFSLWNITVGLYITWNITLLSLALAGKRPHQ